MLATVISTGTRLPGAMPPAGAGNVVTLLVRVRPASRRGSFFEGPSTMTSWTVPSSARFRRRLMAFCSSMSRSRRSCLTSSGTWSGMAAAGVPGRGENMKVKAESNSRSRTRSRVARKSASVSPGKPAIRSVVMLAWGTARRIRPTSRR